MFSLYLQLQNVQPETYDYLPLQCIHVESMQRDPWRPRARSSTALHANIATYHVLRQDNA